MAWLLRPIDFGPAELLGLPRLLLQLDEPHLRKWAPSHLRGAAQLERTVPLMHHARVRVLSAEVDP
jgi:hypothetical protein